MGYNWETALGAVFVSGVLFLTLSKVREWLLNSIPVSLRHAMGRLLHHTVVGTMGQLGNRAGAFRFGRAVHVPDLVEVRECSTASR